MTGKQLIMYILENNLENVEIVKDGKIVGLISVDELAARFGVGRYTVLAWYAQDKIKGVMVGNSLFFREDQVDPREEAEKNG